MEWYYVWWPWLTCEHVARVCQHQLSFLSLSSYGQTCIKLTTWSYYLDIWPLKSPRISVMRVIVPNPCTKFELRWFPLRKIWRIFRLSINGPRYLDLWPGFYLGFSFRGVTQNQGSLPFPPPSPTPSHPGPSPPLPLEVGPLKTS